MSADTVNNLLGYASAAVFAVVAFTALAMWARRRDRASLWATLSFATLAAVVLVNQILPEHPATTAEVVLQRAMVVGLCLFPYLLFRFTTAFEGAERRLHVAIAIATVALITWTIALPDLPAADEHRSFSVLLFIAALLVEFGTVSLIAAVRLWRAGHGQPSVPRNRMRTLAVALGVLTVALFFAVVAPMDKPVLEIAGSILALASALTFLLGFSPPELVRLVLRRQEQEHVRQAIGDLMAATTPDEVAAKVLPPMARIVGARAVYLLDENDDLIGVHGEAGPVPEPRADVLRIEIPHGSLVIWGSPYAPFFSSDETELLRSLGALTGLALDRSRLFVREREQRIALEQADEMKMNFIALAAHELRTPVTSVHGVVRTLDELGDQLSTADRAELQEALRSQTERMRGLVDQLLDLSRLEAERVAIQPVPVPVRAEVEELVAASANSRSGEVEIEIPDDLEATVDRTVFERVVTNLVVNALLHGASPIVVSADQGDRHFRLSVRDSGDGVPPEFVPELFERFSRSDEARARGLGSGLGLAIARSYARAHGGDLVHEQGDPRGARFELIVPISRGRSDPTGH